jgi:hypothetical protein
MQIKTKLTEVDLIKANFVLLTRKLSTKLYLGILLFVFIYTGVIPAVNGKSVYILSSVAPLVIVVVFISLSTFIGAKISYRSNSRIKEIIEYIFGNDYLEVKGESFSSKLTWEKIYKVTKTKHWLLIWQNRQIANVIPLRDIWKGDITTLKEILNNHGVKNNL